MDRPSVLSKESQGELLRAVLLELHAKDVANLDALAKRGRTSQTAGIVLAILGALGLIIGLAAKNTPIAVLGVLLLLGAGGAFFASRNARSESTSYKPDTRVTGFGAFCMPIHVVKGGFGTYVLDGSGFFPEARKSLPAIRETAKVEGWNKEIGAILDQRAPILEPRGRQVHEVAPDEQQRTYHLESELHSALDAGEALLVTSSDETITAPAHSWDQEVLAAVEDLPRRGAVGDAPVLEGPNDHDAARELIRAIEKKIGERVERLDAVHVGLVHQSSQALDAAFAEKREARRASIEDILQFFVQDISDVTDVSAYNFYCPDCNRSKLDEICQHPKYYFGDNREPVVRLDMTTRMSYSIRDDKWRCPLCSKECTHPVKVHKMADDLLFPVFDTLIKEHHEERLRFYAGAQGQKNDFQNQGSREIEEAFRENRSQAETAQARIRQAESEAGSSREAVKILAIELAAFEALSSLRLSEINSRTDRQMAAIETNRARVLKEFRESTDKALEEGRTHLAECARIARREDAARTALLQEIAVNSAPIAGDKARKNVRKLVKAQRRQGLGKE